MQIKRTLLALGVAAAILCPFPANADCIASSMNVFGIVQSADAITTNGPVAFKYPGGFLTQNAAAHCGQPGFPSCAFIEGDRTASRAGCVKSLGTDAGCVILTNGAVRESEYIGVRATPDTSKDRVRKDLCFVNYTAAVLYAAIVIPNNLHAVYQIQKTGAYAKVPQALRARPSFNLTLRTWRFH